MLLKVSLSIIGAAVIIGGSLYILAEYGIFKLDFKDAIADGDFEIRLCEEFIFQSGGIMAKWESPEQEFTTIRFCTSYERCVVGCAMLIILTDTAVSGNITKGINRINEELVDVYDINIDAYDFDFDNIGVDDFLAISKISEVVKESTRHLEIGGNPTWED